MVQPISGSKFRSSDPSENS
uniref:Uncharacterized protein n=1 Tax=Rhizophora mucronata TaxID=61149 RepID=A0A2P2IVI6_RHIMU